MRSLLIGDCDHYQSPYIYSVTQAMKLLGHEHANVSIRQTIDTLARHVWSLRPTIIWTHMLLWPPPGSPGVHQLEGLMLEAVKRGSKVVVHDGDCKEQPRYPKDISAWCAVALVNHGYDRSVWRCPILPWPYCAFTQASIEAPSIPAIAGKLFFAGTAQAGALYDARNRLIDDVRQRVPMHVHPPDGGNTLFRTAKFAPSALAVLGFGRPEAPGWTDTRVFQYPGAGGILIHDHAPQLEPWEHFVPYVSGSADSVVEAFQRVQTMTETERTALRERAFAFVQKYHSSVARVRQVLDLLFGSES